MTEEGKELDTGSHQRSYPTWGNALRINDQAISRYPLTLIVHDRTHLELAAEAEERFGGCCPLGYIGTSPWLGSVTNQKRMDYGAVQSLGLFAFLREQMEIGWVLYGLETVQKEERREESEIRAMIKDMRKYCPQARQIWVRKSGEEISRPIENILTEYGLDTVEYGSREELAAWLNGLKAEVEKAQPPVRYDTLEREWAEWTNLSVTLPQEEEENRILLVGDSISVGYGDMVQKRMPGWHVDRLNTSEGVHHPNFLRLLEIALGRYPYRIVHINNGIHLHGQTVEEYGRNLSAVLDGIRRISPGTEIIFATTTPLSRSLSADELEHFDPQHFSMGDRLPLGEALEKGGYWVTDEEASDIYRQLNEEAKRICRNKGIPVDDLYGLCVEENLQKSDGVHFQEEGYRRLADRVAGSLGDVLAMQKKDDGQ